ncbi:MAG: type II toxin-antitoxin system Phd/YefM family antitoxin [Terriglobia bacterium]
MSATELHRNTTEVLRKAHKLGSVVVTLRGKRVAKLVSLQPNDVRSVAKGPVFGMWKGREDMKNPQAWVREIRRPRYRLSVRQKT